MRFAFLLKKRVVALLLSVTAVLLFFLVELPVIVSSSESNICNSSMFASEREQSIKSHQQGLNPMSISMTVWNIHKEQDEGWKKDLAHFSEKSDLLLLQEGYAKDELYQFFSEENMHWSMATTFTYKEVGAGVVTGSVVVPVVACSLFEAEPLIRLPKGILVTKYPLTTNKSLLVANVHLVNFSVGIEEYKQQLQTLLSVIDSHKGPLIVAGDFNSWRTERQKAVEQFAKALGLEFVSFENDVRTTFMGFTLDHVLVRGLDIESTKTMEVTSSDHNPLFISFSVK